MENFSKSIENATDGLIDLISNHNNPVLHLSASESDLLEQTVHLLNRLEKRNQGTAYGDTIFI